MIHEQSSVTVRVARMRKTSLVDPEIAVLRDNIASGVKYGAIISLMWIVGF